MWPNNDYLLVILSSAYLLPLCLTYQLIIIYDKSKVCFWKPVEMYFGFCASALKISDHGPPPCFKEIKVNRKFNFCFFVFFFHLATIPISWGRYFSLLISLPQSSIHFFLSSPFFLSQIFLSYFVLQCSQIKVTSLQCCQLSNPGLPHSPTLFVNTFGLFRHAMNTIYTGTLVAIIRHPMPVSTGLAIIGTNVTKTEAIR